MLSQDVLNALNDSTDAIQYDNLEDLQNKSSSQHSKYRSSLDMNIVTIE